MIELIEFRQLLQPSPRSHYFCTSSPACYQNNHDLWSHFFPVTCRCWPFRSNSSDGSYSHHARASHPAALPFCCFVTARLPPAGGWRGWGWRGAPRPHWALFSGPILLLHWCAAAVSKSSPWFWASSFFILVFSLLLWTVSPPRTPRTWRWSFSKALIYLFPHCWAEPLGHWRAFLNTFSNLWGQSALQRSTPLPLSTLSHLI